MNYIPLLLLNFVMNAYGADIEHAIVALQVPIVDKTSALHEEVRKQNNPYITKDTHPVLYNLIRELTIRAGVPMPRYIVLYSARYNMVLNNGVVVSQATNMEAYIDVMGDLHLCYEVVSELSYEQVRGIIATAIAEKIVGRPKKAAIVGVGVFGLVAYSLYWLNKKYELNLGASFWHDYDHLHHRDDYVEAILALLVTPAFIAAYVTSNNLQRNVDMSAAAITSKKDVIQGIKGLCKLKDAYVQESMWSRLATKLKLKKLYSVLFYPLRAFTPQERINYLERA